MKMKLNKEEWKTMAENAFKDSGNSPPEPFLGFSKFEPGTGAIHGF
jgi:hypothetical protein